MNVIMVKILLAFMRKLDLIDAWTIQARAATLLHGLGFSQQQLQLPVKSFRVVGVCD